MAQRRVTDPRARWFPSLGAQALCELHPRRQRPRVVARHPVARGSSPRRSTSRPSSRSRSDRRGGRPTRPRVSSWPAGWRPACVPRRPDPLPQPHRCHLGAPGAGERHGRPRAAAGRQHRDAVPAGTARPPIALAHRGDAECLADELRRLDPDEVYRRRSRSACARSPSRHTASEAVKAGKAPRSPRPSAPRRGCGARRARAAAARWSRPADAAAGRRPGPGQAGRRPRLAKAQEDRA